MKGKEDKRAKMAPYRSPEKMITHVQRWLRGGGVMVQEIKEVK